MPHFDAIIEQKNKLKEKLLQNQNVVDLLVNTGDNVEEFEHVKCGSKSPAASLIKKHFYVPDTAQVDKNFITMRSRVVYADTDVIKEVSIVIYIICNKDQIDLIQGSRADLLANEIDQTLNNGSDPLFGLGGIKIGVAEEVNFADGFTGWQIPFFTHEMNRRAELL